jgi:hypothetical protein
MSGGITLKVGGPKTRERGRMSRIADFMGRIMRVGDQFSSTNQKLRSAVEGFVVWLFERVGEWGLPDPAEFKWSLVRNRETGKITLGFEQEVGGWEYVHSSDNPASMWSIHAFCETLAGPRGDRLVLWLEETEAKRGQFLIALEAFRLLAPKDSSEAEASGIKQGLLWTRHRIDEALAKLTSKDVSAYTDRLDRK